MTTKTAALENAPSSGATPAGNAGDESKGKFAVGIVGAAAFAHLLNDLIQAMLPAIFPMLKTQFSLSFSEIGMIALIYQATHRFCSPG